MGVLAMKSEYAPAIHALAEVPVPIILLAKGNAAILTALGIAHDGATVRAVGVPAIAAHRIEQVAPEILLGGAGDGKPSIPVADPDVKSFFHLALRAVSRRSMISSWGVDPEYSVEQFSRTMV